MKYILYILVAFLVACHGGEKASKPATAGVSKETALLKLSAQYPDSALITEELAQNYRDSGEYTRALYTISNALQRDSTNARLWNVQAWLYAENGDTSLSLYSLERSIAIFPNPDVVISLGNLYAKTKDAEALKVADELIKEDKAKFEKEALFIKGVYYSSTGDKNKAIAFFDQCLSLSYSFMEAYLEKALVLYDLGKYKDAVAALDKATTLQNNFDQGYFYKGRCYEKLNDTAKAIEAYQAAMMYDPGYVEAKEALEKITTKN
ncbi:MAG: tetratricopeptide repeat protein [Rhizobacter sp.]|nr:tetratricopeptide repeat protein [Ferruginibacter sp.]